MVRIQRLRLVNFAPIKIALGINDFELNRSNTQNSILLLIGANGSGKTTILTEASPAIYENIRGRSGSSRILSNKDGIKELDIVKDFKFLYEIKIDYPQKGSTKCSIKKKNLFTGEDFGELNPNGNVKSYYDVVERELGWTQKYINVGFLSSAVTNIVMMKAQERNDYLSIWLPNLSEYFDGYRIAIKQFNAIKKQIDILNNDIGKLTNVSYEIDINNLTSSLESVEKEYYKILEHINRHETYIQMIPDNSTSSIDNYIESFIIDVKKSNETRSNIINSYMNIIQYSGKDGKLKIAKDISNSEKNVIIYGEQIKSINEDIKRLNSSLEDIKIEKDFDKTYYNSLYINLENIKKELTYLENLKKSSIKDNSSFSTFTEENMTLAKYETFTRFFDELISSYQRVTDLVQLEYLSTQKVFDNREKELMTIKNNQKVYIEKIDNEIGSISNRIYALEHSTLNKDLLELRPSDCVRSCGIVDEIIKFVYPEKELKDLRDKLNSLIKEKSSSNDYYSSLNEELHSYTLAKNLIFDLNNRLFKQANFIAEFPPLIKDFFAIDDIFLIFSNLKVMQRSFSNLDEFISLLDKIKTLKESHSNIESKISELKITADLFETYQNTLKEFQEVSQRKDSLINLYKNENDNVANLKSINDILEDSKKEIDLHNKLVDTLEDRKQNLRKLINRWYIRGQLIRNLGILNVRKIEKKERLDHFKEELTNLQNKKATISVLTESRDKYIEKNKKLNAMLNVWSPKVGYPAWEMEEFLDTLTVQTNKDLSEMWGSSLSIEQFKIGANEFSIPINRDGTILDDVIECSDGEKATLALAISFAIIEINLRDKSYNIIRLDESDATLDAERKRTFIYTILSRLPALDCQDLWIISHSPIIDDIEADIVLLKGHEMITTNLTNKNILYQYGT